MKNIKKLKIEYIPVGDIIPYDKNPRKNENAVPYVKASIEKFGFKIPLVLDDNKVIVCGHTRLKAAMQIGYEEVPCILASDLTPEQIRAFRLADNKVAEKAEWDNALLGEELLALPDFDFGDLGFDLADFKVDKGKGVETKSLSDRFLVPPLSILDSRQGYWRDRKAKWNEALDSKKGRDNNLLGQDLKNIYGGTSAAPNTSEFDPVLAEIAMLWFNVEGGTVLDPFCGGSVRGIMAARLGHRYMGFDIRQEQVDANYKQLTPAYKDLVNWICDDSTNLLDHTKGELFDMVFSCPPYADLEVYSDKPGDLSNMPYDKFVEAYRKIIANACAALKDDRFAMFVVGDVRDKKTGAYRNFIGATKQAFIDAGLQFVNDIIYIEPVGGSAIRAAGTFNAGRKVVKTHQNVLVFYKGDLKNVKNHYPAITEARDFESVFEEEGDGEEAADSGDSMSFSEPEPKKNTKKGKKK